MPELGTGGRWSRMSIFRFLNPFHVIEVLKNIKAITEEYGKTVEALDARLKALDARLRALDIRLEDIDIRLKDMETAYEFQKTKISMLEKKTKNQAVEQKSAIAGQNHQVIVESGAQQTYSKIDYFDFENHFRGSMEHIREAQKIYLKYFMGHSNVIDLGCGRGEFLELLKENEIDAQGVDFYEEFVEMCRLKDLKVAHGDALDFLKAQEKVGGIFAAQLIEHLSVDQLVTLCELAFEKLEEGGYVILETPNPSSLSIYTKSFYIDPSHNKPVHPFTAQYILQRAGFKNVEILYTDASKVPVVIPPIEMENMEEFNYAMKQVENMLFGSQDYAVIAMRQGS